MSARTEGASGQHDVCDELITDLRVLLAERDAAAEASGRDALLAVAAELEAFAARLDDVAMSLGRPGFDRNVLLASAYRDAAELARKRAVGKPESQSPPAAPRTDGSAGTDGTGDPDATEAP